MHLCIFIQHFEYMPETELGGGVNTNRPGLHQTEFWYKCLGFAISLWFRSWAALLM